MVNTLLVSMRMLSDVLVLIIFFLCVFSLLGMQLFMGELRNKCVVTIPVNINASYSQYVTNSSKLWIKRFMISAHSFPQYVVDLPAIPACVTHHCVWPLCNSPFFFRQMVDFGWKPSCLWKCVFCKVIMQTIWWYNISLLLSTTVFFSFPIVEHVPEIIVVIHTLVLIQITTLLRSITSAGRFLLHFNCLHSTSGKMFTTM